MKDEMGGQEGGGKVRRESDAFTFLFTLTKYRNIKSLLHCCIAAMNAKSKICFFQENSPSERGPNTVENTHLLAVFAFKYNLLHTDSQICRIVHPICCRQNQGSKSKSMRRCFYLPPSSLKSHIFSNKLN